MSDTPTVRIESLDLPTYVPGPESPYHVFGFGEWPGYYPYAAKSDLSTTATQVKHRAVVLENRYLRAVVLPDLGGHLFSLYDKVDKRETFMTTPTIKFQNVALRGAWLAGGIEWNFGRPGHALNTESPVSWATRKHPDGTVSVWIGAAILPTESRYAIRISLGPDRAALDVAILAMAPHVLPGNMYYWSNAGVEVSAKSRFYYFGKCAHAGAGTHSWPICDGLDYQWYRNRFVGSDMFLRDVERDYMAFYDFGRQHGVVQNADRAMAPGQKYFTWGTHQQGRYWDKLFSDAGQTYCEIQRGRLPTQGETRPMPPMSTESWTETWAPIGRTDGFSGFESNLVLSVVPRKGAAEVCLLSIVPQGRVRVEARSGDRLLAGWELDEMPPRKIFSRRVKLPRDGKCDGVKVLAADGRVLMDWKEYVFPDEDWFKSPEPGYDARTATLEQTFMEAERCRMMSWPWPFPFPHGIHLYQKVLEKDSGHVGAHKAMAEIALHAGEIEKAMEHLRTALQREPYGVDLLCLLGWAHLRSDQEDQAVEPFSLAARCEPGRRNGLLGLASAHVKAGRLSAAEGAVASLLAEFPRDGHGRLMRALILRRSGRREEALPVISELLAEDPLWWRLHTEALLLNLPTDLAGGTRKIMDDSLLGAVPYMELGLWDDAEKILQVEEANDTISPAVRLAHLAYVQRKLGREAVAARTIDKACAAPVEHANPSLAFSLRVLRELAQWYPDKAAVHNMLGNILAGRGRRDEAEAEWKHAAELKLEHATVLRNLAMAAHLRNQNDTALACYRKAWQVSGRDVHLFAELDELFKRAGRIEDRFALYDELPRPLRDRPIPTMRRADQLVYSGRYVEALRFFRTREFYGGEGEQTARRLYLQAVVGRAVELFAAGKLAACAGLLAEGLKYPRNINIGRSGILPNEAMVRYFLGIVAEARGRNSEAHDHWLAAASEYHWEGSIEQGYEMLAWQALGNFVRAHALAHDLEALARRERDLPRMFGYYATFPMLEVNHGLVQLFKRRIDDALRMWQKANAANPSARWCRVHANLPRSLLERMSRKATGRMK